MISDIPPFAVDRNAPVYCNVQFSNQFTLPGALLTPKEAHILALLATGLSNKLIACAMEISDETVKWHLKNLFAKLSAGSRKHAVGRARLLGLLPD